MRCKISLIAIVACLSISGTSAQVARPLAPLDPASKIAAQGPAPGQALISGTAVDIAATPLANVTVRLRNLVNNQIEHVATANRLGEFTFVARPEVPYVVEIADAAGRIIAVGDVITAQAGDVAATVVSIPTRLPALAGVFSDTAGSVISAAASAGVTVIPTAPPLSPEK